MGNGGSSQDKLHAQLQKLEEKIDSIEATDTNTIVAWPNADQDQSLYGIPIIGRPGISIVVGPIIGKVTASSVKILIEVNKSVTITASLSLVDRICRSGRMVSSQRRRMTGNVPMAFTFTDLLPGKRYTVVFSGVNMKDAKDRIGHFMTCDLLKKSMHVMAIR